ncbi:MAG: methionyl-tRNA formyltransferase [Chlamydiia bacterium]|nr:methionyl-tRNA formyltransferase [Chlamydiia bacterium]
MHVPMPLRIVFFGTPPFAASLLSYLLDAGIPILAIVTQPDRPQGRSLQKAFSAVKKTALERAPEIPLLQPEKGSDPDFLSSLRALQADLFVVVAFGQILPQQLLDIPPKGCINLHASLLPKYRGAAPIQRVLIQGENETGVAIQKMVKQLDAGDVIVTARMEIPLDMIFGELEEALCELSKPLLLLVLQSYVVGIPPAEPQNHSLATHAAKISTEEGEIHWAMPALKIHNLIRAFSPRPGAWCWFRQGEQMRRIKILRTALCSGQRMQKEAKPGQILSDEGVVICGDGVLKLLVVQPEGKGVMDAASWLRGFREPPYFQ